MARILIPLPATDFDVTEVAVPWRLLTRAGHDVAFAAPAAGIVPAADPLLLTGVVFGQLGAEPEPKAFYAEMERDERFRRPITWDEIDPSGTDAILLPGGHAPGMKPYLESTALQRKVAEIWSRGRPVAAICHGVLLMARARDPGTGRSLIASRSTTCLPKYMERAAYLATAWKVGRYFRTYPAYVEDEVRAALDDPTRQFQRGPRTLFTRGTERDDRGAFVVRDGPYLSARWPGDAYLLARTLMTML